MLLYRLGNETEAKSAKMLKIFGILIIIAAATGLSGCSFQPLYGTTASGSQLTEELKSITISNIPGRVGQRVRNELIYQVTNGGAPLPSLYRLEVAIRESETATLVESSGDSQGQIYSLNAEFKLVRLRDSKVIFGGKSHSRAAYDKSFFDADTNEQVNSAFGNVRARIDAENRASKTLAEELKTRIAAFLATSA